MSYEQAVEAITERAETGTPSYACFSNVHMTIEAHQSSQFADYVNKADFAFADGMPLVFAYRFLHGIRQERIAGMDFMPSILEACQKKNLSVLLFGSTDDVLEKIKDRIQKDYQGIVFAGAISPPFGTLSGPENEAFVKKINEAKPNIVLVALGCPKQETWMAQNSHKINAVLLGVGGAFPVFANMQKRSPKWMQKLALEWVYRLWQEPGRLWKRYFTTNTLFVFLLIKEKLRKVFS